MSGGDRPRAVILSMDALAEQTLWPGPPATRARTPSPFAREALAVAQEVLRAEAALLDAILESARHGDCARVERIALAWRDMAALHALKAIQD